MASYFIVLLCYLILIHNDTGRRFGIAQERLAVLRRNSGEERKERGKGVNSVRCDRHRGSVWFPCALNVKTT